MNDLYSEKEMSEDLYKHLKIMENDQVLKQQEFQITENSDSDSDEEEFSFVCVGEDGAAIGAEDAFIDGQIKAVFPLFDQSLLFSGEGELPADLPVRPPVKKIFVESSAGDAAEDGIAGPYCEWSSRKAVEASPEASPEACKKSNSTGFSKIWRLKEITCRSNSDGRDAFVFLNGSHAQPEKQEQAAVKVKKSGKGKVTASPHEVYLRSKAKEEERRRSYLPYRVGFFTNVNGGLTRNVHPF